MMQDWGPDQARVVLHRPRPRQSFFLGAWMISLPCRMRLARDGPGFNRLPTLPFFPLPFRTIPFDIGDKGNHRQNSEADQKVKECLVVSPSPMNHGRPVEAPQVGDGKKTNRAAQR